MLNPLPNVLKKTPNPSDIKLFKLQYWHFKDEYLGVFYCENFKKRGEKISEVRVGSHGVIGSRSRYLSVYREKRCLAVLRWVPWWFCRVPIGENRDDVILSRLLLLYFASVYTFCPAQKIGKLHLLYSPLREMEGLWHVMGNSL